MTSSISTAIGSFSPLLPVPLLGCIYFRMSSSTFTAVGNFLFFRLIRQWDTHTLSILSHFHSYCEFSPLLPVPLLGCTDVALADLVLGTSWYPIAPTTTRRDWTCCEESV